jgi:gag-polypeptide of LTR copia-type
MNYLVTPAPTVATSSPAASDAGDLEHVADPPSFTPDPATRARAKAFLSQSIDYRYRSAIETCTSAAEIWSVFLARHGQCSRDDELRLEAELLSLVKLSTQTLDQFTERFDDLISSIRAQQEPNQHWDDRKVNMHFIRSLELSNIPNEDWKAWSTYIGSSHGTMSHDSLQAACRTYYTTHMLPRLRSDPDSFVYRFANYAPFNQDHQDPSFPSQANDSTGRRRSYGNDRETRSSHGHNNGQNGRWNNNNNSNDDTDYNDYYDVSDDNGNKSHKAPRKLPTNPNAWCTHCKRPGHASSYCFRRYKESDSNSTFEDWCSSQASTTTTRPQPARPQAPSGNRPSQPETVHYARAYIATSRRVTKNTRSTTTTMAPPPVYDIPQAPSSNCPPAKDSPHRAFVPRCRDITIRPRKTNVAIPSQPTKKQTSTPAPATKDLPAPQAQAPRHDATALRNAAVNPIFNTAAIFNNAARNSPHRPAQHPTTPAFQHASTPPSNASSRHSLPHESPSGRSQPSASVVRHSSRQRQPSLKVRQNQDQSSSTGAALHSTSLHPVVFTPTRIHAH